MMEFMATHQILLAHISSETIILRNYEAENFSLFGNIDYFLADNLKLAFGLRWENWNSKYNDSNKVF